MKILVSVDGSPFTKRMLAYLAAHDEWLGAAHRYTVLHVVPAVPARAAAALDRQLLKEHYDDEAAKVFAPIREFFEQKGIQADYVSKVGSAGDLIAEVADKADVAALVQSGWVGEADFPRVPAVKERPASIVYGPLDALPVAPDVVFLRLNPKQAMVLDDAMGGVRFEGKPQCHIMAIAKDDREIAVSVGCMLSRVRTGMNNNELSCAIPASRLAEVAAALRANAETERQVAAYAAADAARFAGGATN